jgi:fibronectin type 3 domain-containing protein
MNDSTKLIKVLLLSLTLSLLCAAAALPHWTPGAGGAASPNDAGQTPDYGTNLWLQISSVTNGKVSLILYHPAYTQTGEVYGVWSKTDLTIPEWNIETDVWAVVNQNWTPFSVSMLDRTNLFIQARDWTGVDENSNGIPDWWEYEHPGGWPPVITAQPASQIVIQGNGATFSVVVSSNSAIPLSYQWFFNETNAMVEATNSSLVLTDVQPSNEGNYSVVVTNVMGSAASSNAILTVLVPPVITTQPASQTAIQGTNVTFSVSVSANSTLPLNYQWYFNTNTLLAGAIDATLILTNVQTTNTGGYSVVITNMAGSVTSAVAMLALNCDVAPSGLVYWWPGNVDINDYAGTNNGSLNGGATYATGKVHQAFDLNGTNGFVSTSVQLANPQNFTLELWFNTTTTNGGVLMGFGNSQTGNPGSYDRQLYMDNTGKLHFGIWSGSAQMVNSIAGYNDDSWHHVAATISTNVGSCLYVDGMLVASNLTATAGQNYSGWWRIGHNNLSSWPSQPTSYYFKGLIDEASIYNRVLSSNEIATIYSAGSAGKCLPPWPTPATPSNLVAMAISPTQVGLTWDDPANCLATQIGILRSTSLNGSYQLVAQTANATSYVDTNLTGGTTYYYQVVAINYSTWSDYSNIAQVTTPDGGAPLPSGALTLWLKADAGLAQGSTNTPVSVWADQSGKGNNATQTTSGYQPVWVRGVIADRPVVRYNGSNSYFNLPSFLTGLSQAEVFVVLDVSPSVSLGQLWSFGNSGNWGNENYPYGTILKEDFGSTRLYDLGAQAQPLTQFHVFNVSAHSTNWAAWINGNLLYQTNNNPVGFGSSLKLGANCYYFWGDMAEVMIFNRALTAGERVTVNTYLNGKYGLVPAMPAAPTNLVATAISPAQIGLTWEASLNGGITQIGIERSTSSNGEYLVVGQVANKLSYYDTNLTAGTTYYYRVRAINLTQWSAYSGVASATTPVSGADLPVESMVLWLKADAGLTQGSTNTPVSYWEDQSGKQNHARQVTKANQPAWIPGVIGDRPVVRYNGSNAYFNLPSFLIGSNQAEAFLVLDVSPSVSLGQLWSLGNSGNGTYEKYPENGRLKEDFGSTGLYDLGIPVQPLTQFHVFNVSAQSTNWAAWINGSLLYQTNNNPVGFGSSPKLGANSYYFWGDMAEVMIFSRALTASERVTVNSYLNGKYGLVPAVPAAPTNLVATAISPTQIGLTWEASLNGGFTRFGILRSTSSNGLYQLVAQIPNATSYVDTNLTAGTTCFYQVVAINLTQWSPTSNIAQATTPVIGEGLPFDSLALWLKADAGLLQENTNTALGYWEDQSGKQNHARQLTVANQPVWVPATAGARPFVRFDGTNDLLKLAVYPATNNFTVFVMARTSQSEEIDAENNSTGNNSGQAGEHYVFGGDYDLGYDGAEVSLSLGTNGMSVYQFMHNGSGNDQASPLAVYGGNVGAGFSIIAVECTNQQPNIYLNGSLVRAGLPSLRSQSIMARAIGYSSYGPFGGDVAEILAFNRVLTGDELWAVAAYLNGKYRVMSSVPDAPVNLMASAVSPNQISLTWVNTATNARQFQIERRLGSEGSYQQIDIVSGTTTSFMDTGLALGTQYYYRVRAANLAGNSGYSNETNATTLTAGVALPLEDLKVWLRADAQVDQAAGSQVSRWRDQSGNANDAVQTTGSNQPLLVTNAINGFPAIRFDGTNDQLMLTAYPATNNFTVFAVARTDQGIRIDAEDNGTGNNIGLTGEHYVFGGGLDPGYGNSQMSLSLGTNGVSVYQLMHNGSGNEQAAPQAVYSGNVVSGFSVLIVVCTNQQPFIYLNEMYARMGLPSLDSQTYMPKTIGFGGYGPFGGDVAEMMVFNRAISADERLAVNNYLNGKYGLAPRVPTAPLNVVAEAVSSSQIGLAWDGTLDGVTTMFSIERKTGGSGTYAVVAQVTNTLSYVDTNGLTAGTLYYYRLRTWNDVKWSDYSTETGATTLTNGVVPLENLKLWLMADIGIKCSSSGVVVTNWLDRRGYGLSASMNGTSLTNGANGHKAMHFSGGTSGQYGTFPDFMSGFSQSEAYIVLRTLSRTAGLPLWVLGGTLARSAYPSSEGHIADSFGNANEIDMGIPLQDVTQFHLYNPSSQIGQWDARINGQLICSSDNVTVTFTTIPSVGNYYWLFNGYLNTGPLFFGGDISEILIFDRVLTAQERDAVGVYLNNKYTLVTAAPPVPGALQATGVSPNQINLSWTNTLATNGLLFTIERKTGSDGVYAPIGTIRDTNSYLDSTILPGTNYFYRVKSWNFNGESDYSSEASPPSATITGPAPQSVFVTGTNVAISAAAADLDGTVTNVSFWVNDALAVSTNNAPYVGVLTNLSAGVYNVMAMATDDQGNSSFSATITLIVSPDTDGDGISDYEEILLGTDPTDPDDPGPWTPPGSSSAPTIILTEPANAVLLP